MTAWLRKGDLGRMIDWLIWAMCFHFAAIVLRHFAVEPQVQTVLWKLGNLTVAAYAGYWIDRRAFRARIESWSCWQEQMRRAIIIAAAMLAVSLGM